MKLLAAIARRLGWGQGTVAAEPGSPVSKKRRKPAISDQMLARSALPPETEKVNPFVLPQHPPGVVPSGTQMAMDDATAQSQQWAALAAEQYSEGLAFLGYPALAQLAQRPEYRKISETIATEMTRKWIVIQASGDEDKTDKVTKITEAFKRLNVQEVFREAALQDGFFGRSHVYIDLGTSEDRDELQKPIGDGHNEISRAKIAKGALKRLRNVEAVWCSTSNYNAMDPLAPDFYRPSDWYVQGKEIHSSRLLTFVGRSVPDLLKPAYAFGGLSLSQMAKPYVDNWIRTRQSVSDLLHSFSTNGIKVNLVDQMNVDDGAELFKRIKFFTNMRDNKGVMVLDKGGGADDPGEEFFNVSTPLGTLDKLQAQAQEQICSVASIPLVKFTGLTPSGLNASSEGEIRVFYDWIAAYQELLFTENLTRVLGFVQLSEFGEIDPAITFKFEPLWSLDEKGMADVRKTEAETGAVLIASKVITPAEERQRIGNDPDTLYASLDENSVPVAGISDTDKATIAATLTAAIVGAADNGLVDEGIVLRELANLAPATGLWSTITAADIAEADAEPPAPEPITPPEEVEQAEAA